MNKKYSICIITTVAGSIKAFFLEQIEYLSNNGFEVTVICSEDEELRKILYDKVQYIAVDMKRGIDPIGGIRAILRMRRIFKENNFYIIQYSTPNAAFYASIASKLVKCKVRLYHNMGYRYLSFRGVKKNIFKTLEKITCRLSTEVQLVSLSNLEFGVNEKLFSSKKARIIWNGSTGGVNLNRFSIRNRNEWRSEILNRYDIKDKFIFGFVGRITKDKGIDELLLAYKKFIKKYKESLLIIVGVEDNTNLLNLELYRWAKTNKQILFVGRSEEVNKFFSAFDVLVLPSYREGFGNVVIEAQAMGTPVIVSNIPGPIDCIKNGMTGIVVPPKRSDLLFNAMEDIYLNENRREQMGTAAYKYIIECFDSRKLIHYILEDKKRLIKENYKK